MNAEEFRDRMAKIEADSVGDCETDHSEADDLLCEALRELGYGEGVDAYDKISKWYS